MKIVKLTTSEGRILYAIQKRYLLFFKRYQSLLEDYTWWSTEDIFNYCASPSLSTVEDRYKRLTKSQEQIVHVVKQKKIKYEF